MYYICTYKMSIFCVGIPIHKIKMSIYISSLREMQKSKKYKTSAFSKYIINSERIKQKNIKEC